MQASIHPRTSLDATRPALVYVMILLCALLAGCGASSPPHEAAEAEASPASGAERPTSLEESAVAGDGDATNDGFQSEGGEGPGAPPTEATRTEEDAFERLLQASSRYDVALSQSSVDCSEARELVERICYLAERVCAQPGVAARDDDAEAHCDEGRARCTRSEARLRSACP